MTDPVKRLLPLILLVAGSAISHAQTPRVVIETGVERDVSMYRWTFGGSVVQSAGPWSFEADNIYRSDAFILFEDRLRFRDENQLRWRLGRPISASTWSISEGRLSYFSQSRVLIQHALSGIEYRSSDRFMIRPAVGVALDQRPGARLPGAIPPLRSDAGPSAALAFQARPSTGGDSNVEVAGEGVFHSIRPRQGRTMRLIGSAEGRFEQTRLDGRLSYGGARRDVYQSASYLNRGLPTDQFSETIEAATSDTMLIGVSLQTPLARGLDILGSVDGSLNRRMIRTHRAPEETLYFDTDFERRAVDANVRLTYSMPRTEAAIGLQVGADTESRRLANRDRLPPTQAAQKGSILQQADFDRSLLAARTSGRHRFDAHTVRLETLASIVRRDTPALNLDDRDEAYHSLSAGIESRWSRYLETDLGVFASYYHTVYLNAARSAENNRQRSLRLRPLVRWTPSDATRMQLLSEIRATYTVDDFQLSGRRPSDQAAREMRFDLELEQSLGDGIRVIGQAGYNDLRLGRLLWRDFAEIPFDTLRTYTGWLRIQGGRLLVAEVGARAYVRTSYARGVLLRYDSPVDGTPAVVNRPGREWIAQVGPTSSIRAYVGERSEISFTGWLNVQRVFHQLYGALPEDDAATIRRRARKGTQLVVPNLTLQVRWHL